MKAENLIKNSTRVRTHGEVFTPHRMVNKMLDLPGISLMLRNLTSTFLEPSAGEGAFLIEILHRKLKLALSMSNSLDDYEEKSLLVLSTLYGIELLQDNVEMLVMNMYGEYFQFYTSAIQRFDGKVNKKVLASAKLIIRVNMIQGDTLKGVDSTGVPIILSEWRLLPVKRGILKVQRIEYTLEALRRGGEPLNTNASKTEQLDLFADNLDDFESNLSQQKLVQFLPVRFSEVYKEAVHEVVN